MKTFLVLLLVAACWSASDAQASTNDSDTGDIELNPALDGKDVSLENTEEVRSIIKDLQTAEWTNVTLDKSAEDDERWFGNPFSWLKKKVANKCHCSGRSCGCCFHIPVLDIEGCIGSSQPLFSSSIRFNLGVNQQTIVTVNLKFNKVSRQCGWMPVPFPYLNFCIAERLSQAADGTISLCPSLEMRHDKTVGLSLLFNCLKFKKSFSIGAVPELDTDAVVSVRVLNPFKALIAKYKAQHK